MSALITKAYFLNYEQYFITNGLCSRDLTLSLTLGLHGSLVSSADFFFKINLFEKNQTFQEYHQSVKQFGPRSSRRYYLQRLSAEDTIRQSVKMLSRVWDV